MKFKEKLQLLRTNMKLSQEELANRLDISRQSITKWENGQSFPDIQNLIQLSEIFKVSIDRLVKENDICTISLFYEHKYPMQDIRIFLVRAKNNTYITGENEIMPSQPGSHDFRYEDGDYLYGYLPWRAEIHRRGTCLDKESCSVGYELLRGEPG